MNNLELELELEKLLRKSISDDYTTTIIRDLFEDIKSDIVECADKEYNEDDIKLAVGRVLVDRLNLEV